MGGALGDASLLTIGMRVGIETVMQLGRRGSGTQTKMWFDSLSARFSALVRRENESLVML